MSTYIPASLKDAHDAIESARKEYFSAYEKAHPDFVKARNWFENFLKYDVAQANESENPRLYAHIAVDCLIATDSHRDAAWIFTQCFEVDLNEGEEVVAVLRVPLTPDATQERRFSAPIGIDCCGAEFEYSKPAKEEDDRLVVPLQLAALAIAASRPMLAAVRDLGERLDRCEGWKPHERFTLKERLSEFGLDSGEHEVEVVYEARPYLLGAFGEREPILPQVESVKVTPELAEDGLERFHDALIKGGYESWMQLLHDLGYKEKEYKWGCQYVLKARVAADGSLIGD